MTLHKEYLGDNEDGSPHFSYTQDDPSKPLVVTGPVFGVKTLEDGTKYDVSDHVIEVATPEHAAEVAHLIGLHHEAHDHPLHKADPNAPAFVYTRPTEEV